MEEGGGGGQTKYASGKVHINLSDSYVTLFLYLRSYPIHLFIYVIIVLHGFYFELTYCTVQYNLDVDMVSVFMDPPDTNKCTSVVSMYYLIFYLLYIKNKILSSLRYSAHKK